MDVVSSGRQHAREEKSRKFQELLSSAFSVAQPPNLETSSVLSVRDKIAQSKHERFLARLDCN